MTRPIRAAVLGLALTLGTAGLAACSGGSSSAKTASSTPSASASASASATRGFGGGMFASAKVQACLKAAGITVPSGRAGGFPSGSRPSGSFPSGARPSGSRPSGSRPSGARAGFGDNSAEGQKIRAALKACGITLPTGGNRPSGSGATPSASPTS